MNHHRASTLWFDGCAHHRSNGSHACVCRWIVAINVIGLPK